MENIRVFICAVVAISLFSGPGESKIINLQDDLTPVPLPSTYIRKEYIKTVIQRLAQNNEYKLPEESTRKPVGSKTPVVGSDGYVYTDRFDKGLFSTIFNAYAKHWVLVTTPEDWWFTIIRKVAMDIDAKSEDPEVRDFFVNHKGKKELTVSLGTSVYGANYSNFFDQMTDQIGENINKPEYVKIMNSDFSTSSKIHKIIANIAIMSSVQEYFSFTGAILCGIPKIEMKGSEDDWVKLITKFDDLESYLDPIQDIIGQRNWFPKARNVTQKLLDTYRGTPDEAWWARIVSKTGHELCGVPAQFDGWFVEDFLYKQPDDLPSGLISVPMKITDGNTEEQSALVAGIPGFMVEENNNETRIQAVHAWTLMLEQNSVFRNDIADWEETHGIL